MQAIEGARMQGASIIIGIDVNNLKCKKGTTFGMTHFINPRESGKSISELVKEATGGLGVDYFFECTGVSSLINEAIESLKLVDNLISFPFWVAEHSKELHLVVLEVHLIYQL